MHEILMSQAGLIGEWQVDPQEKEARTIKSIYNV